MKELLPPLTAVNTPYWAGLERGEVRFQECLTCGNRWLPPRVECTRCLGSDVIWSVASGNATLISWVVYRQTPHPAFADSVPYSVGIVELAEGPRLVMQIVGGSDRSFEGASPSIDGPGRIEFRRSDDIDLPVFVTGVVGTS